MAENIDEGANKSWWESQLDWNLADSLVGKLQSGGRLLRNIPATLSAYRLSKPAPIDQLEPDPVVKISSNYAEAAEKTGSESLSFERETVLKAEGELQEDREPALEHPPAATVDSKFLVAPPKPVVLNRREERVHYHEQPPWVTQKKVEEVKKLSSPVPTIKTPPAAVARKRVEEIAKPRIEIFENRDVRISSVSAIETPKPTPEEDDDIPLTLEQLLDPDFCGYKKLDS